MINFTLDLTPVFICIGLLGLGATVIACFLITFGGKFKLGTKEYVVEPYEKPVIKDKLKEFDNEIKEIKDRLNEFEFRPNGKR